MGRVVTQNRSTPNPNKTQGRFLRFGWQWQDVKSQEPTALFSQSTTSYRSGTSELDAPPRGRENPEWTPTNRSEYSDMLRRDRRDASRPYDTGHDFSTQKKTFDASRSVDISSVDGQFRFVGRLSPDTQTFPLPSGRQPGNFPPAPSENITYWGARGINATAPTHPAASLATTLIELMREGLPSLPGLQAFRQQGNPSSLGGEHLNVEFGFKPLASGLAQSAFAVSESAKILRQYQRDSGRIVRRKRDLHEESETSSGMRKITGQTGTVFKKFQNAANTTLAEKSTLFKTGDQYLHETITTNRRYWFSAGYSYYLQDDNSHLNRLFEFEDKANRLLGIRITPEVVWDIAPWSWLADWGVNIGDNISNAVALAKDGLVIRWAYVMCTTVRTHSVTGIAPLARGGYVSATESWTEITKTRTAATPFGFGLNPTSFTNRQWSILAALGMTKSDRSLRQFRNGD